MLNVDKNADRTKLLKSLWVLSKNTMSRIGLHYAGAWNMIQKKTIWHNIAILHTKYCTISHMYSSLLPTFLSIDLLRTRDIGNQYFWSEKQIVKLLNHNSMYNVLMHGKGHGKGHGKVHGKVHGKRHGKVHGEGHGKVLQSGSRIKVTSL